MRLLLTIQYKLEYLDAVKEFKNHQNYNDNTDDNKTIEFATDGHVSANNLQEELEATLEELRIEKYKFNKEW